MSRSLKTFSSGSLHPRLLPVIGLVLCATIGLTNAGQAQTAPSPKAILARAAAAYQGAKTIRASFEQTITNTLTGTTNTARGELFRQHPHLLALVFSDPPEDRIIADGTSLWVYLPSSAPGQVIKSPAGAAQGGVPDPIGNILSASSGDYHVTSAGMATIAGHATHAVSITPTKAMTFTKATVWIDDTNDVMRQVEVTEPSGLVRRVVITKFTTNVSIPRRTFTFTPPAKARVIERPAS